MRRMLVLAAVLAAVGLLSACDKPIPRITLQSGSTSVTVAPQTYCFDAAHCHFRDSGGVGALHTRAGATILIDVPREVADGAWSARSATLDAKGSFRTLAGAGLNSGTERDNHVVRLLVPYAVGAYYVVVAEQQQAGAWITKITITG